MTGLRTAALIVVLAFATPILASSGVQPDGTSNGTAVCNVIVNVDPTIAIAPIDANVNAGTVQTGDFSALCRFQVDANSEQLYFMVRATSLYKGGIFFDSSVAPIALDLTKGATVQPANGNAVNFQSNTLSYVGPCICLNGLPTTRTEIVQFESSQNGVFSQEVDVTVTWVQPNPEQPQGNYTGYVELVSWIMPPQQND